MISRGFAGLPPFGAGQRIGLFGGSFNPAHDGHRNVALLVLRRLELDWVWWLVTPGNPFKDCHDLPPVAARIEAARRVAAHPRIVVTGAEQTLGSNYTYDIVRTLVERSPAEHFVLIMGADSFVDLHRWKHWRRIVTTIPLCIVDRPGFTLWAAQARAANALRGRRLPEQNAAALTSTEPPAYVFLHGPRSTLSSTQLREA